MQSNLPKDLKVPSPPYTGVIIVCMTILYSSHATFHDYSPDNATFRAYSCTPSSFLISSNEVITECDKAFELINQDNRAYQVLQKDKPSLWKGWSCRREGVLTITYCGRDLPGDIYQDYEYVRDPYMLTGADCEKLWETQRYINSQGTTYQLQRNNTTTFSYYQAGSPPSTTDSNRCNGEHWESSHMGTLLVLENVAVKLEMKITLQEELYRIQGPSIEAINHNYPVPCDIHRGSCNRIVEEPRYAFIWKPEQRVCPYTSIGNVWGYELRDDRHRSVFISMDGSQQRFILRKNIPLCGTRVSETNIPGSYLFPREKDPEHFFPKKYRPTPFEDSKTRRGPLKTGFLHQDSILTQGIGISLLNRTDIIEEFSFQIQEECERLKQIDGFQCRCRAGFVRHRNTSVCYDALPVWKLTLINQGGILKAREEDEELYMEPSSKILKTEGEVRVIPCETPIRPTYTNLQGQVLIAGPELQVIIPETKDSEKYIVVPNALPDPLTPPMGTSDGGTCFLSYSSYRDCRDFIKSVMPPSLIDFLQDWDCLIKPVILMLLGINLISQTICL